MRDRIVFGLMKLLVRLAYGYWPAAVHVMREPTAAEKAERERDARELHEKIMADYAGAQRRYLMVVVDDTLTDLPPITSTPIRGDN